MTTSQRNCALNSTEPDRLPGAAKPVGNLLPLSAAQRGIWFAQHLAGAMPISVAQYVEVTGELRTEVLAAACRTAGREFGSGNLYLRVIEGEPRQFVDLAHGAPVTIVDLRGKRIRWAARVDGCSRIIPVRWTSSPIPS